MITWSCDRPGSSAAAKDEVLGFGGVVKRLGSPVFQLTSEKIKEVGTHRFTFTTLAGNDVCSVERGPPGAKTHSRAEVPLPWSGLSLVLA